MIFSQRRRIYSDSRKRYIRLLIVVLIIVDTLRHIFGGDTRPIDIWMLVIELLVLIVIGAEAVIAIKRFFTHRPKLAKITALLAKGLGLQQSAPVGHAPSGVIGEWKRSVEEWEKETIKYLESCSAQAVSVFLQEVGGGPPIAYNRVSMDAAGEFGTLRMRLANLRTIMERPEVYL